MDVKALLDIRDLANKRLVYTGVCITRVCSMEPSHAKYHQNQYNDHYTNTCVHLNVLNTPKKQISQNSYRLIRVENDFNLVII